MLTKTQIDSGLFLVTNGLAGIQKRLNELQVIARNIADKTDPDTDEGRRAVRLNAVIGNMLRLTQNR